MPYTRCFCCHHQPMASNITQDTRELMRIILESNDPISSCYRPVVTCFPHSLQSYITNMFGLSHRIGKRSYWMT